MIDFVQSTKIFIVKHALLIILGVIFLIFICLTLYLIFPSSIPTRNNPRFTTIHMTSNPLQPLMKVGSETIYQKDLDYEIKNYPPVKDIDIRKLLTEKMINDSITLQEGEKMGLVVLDDRIFNSMQINYLARVQTVSDIQRDMESKIDGIIGTVISIWFFNNDESGAQGYEKGKQIALEKITNLHKEVKNKAITVEQATQEIKNDENLALADPLYVLNAAFDFRVNKGEQITADEKLNDAIWKLPIGGVTDIYIGKSGNLSNNREAVYHFGTVREKIDTGQKMTFESLINQLRKNYEITYY